MPLSPLSFCFSLLTWRDKNIKNMRTDIASFETTGSAILFLVFIRSFLFVSATFCTFAKLCNSAAAADKEFPGLPLRDLLRERPPTYRGEICDANLRVRKRITDLRQGNYELLVESARHISGNKRLTKNIYIPLTSARRRRLKGWLYIRSAKGDASTARNEDVFPAHFHPVNGARAFQ